MRCASRRARRGPARLPAHARAARGSRPGGPARGRAAARGRPQLRGGARDLGATAGRSTTWIGCVPPGDPPGTWLSSSAAALVQRSARARRGDPARPRARRGEALRAAHAALRELRGLAARAPRHGRPGAAARVSTRLGSCACSRSSRCAWVRTPSPTGFRWRAPRRFARRFEVVLTGAQQGELPRGSWPSPSCRTRIAAHRRGEAGSLPVREDRLERERYLFYVSVSRAERLLVLSSRSSDEEENLRRSRTSSTTCVPCWRPGPSCARARYRRSPGRRRRRPPPPSGIARWPRPGRGAPSRAPRRSAPSRC